MKKDDFTCAKMSSSSHQIRQEFPLLHGKVPSNLTGISQGNMEHFPLGTGRDGTGTCSGHENTLRDGEHFSVVKKLTRRDHYPVVKNTTGRDENSRPVPSRATFIPLEALFSSTSQLIPLDLTDCCTEIFPLRNLVVVTTHTYPTGTLADDIADQN